jgi:hypothetical protein
VGGVARTQSGVAQPSRYDAKRLWRESLPMGNADTLWIFSLKGPANGKLIPMPKAPPLIQNVAQIAGSAVRTSKVAIFDYGYKLFELKPRQTGSLIITVPAETKVTWYNMGSQPHTATSPGNLNTGIVTSGDQPLL